MNTNKSRMITDPSEEAWKELIEAIRPRDIFISVNKGVVTLKGTVKDYSKKILAEQIVAGVTGVKAIHNEIVVKLNRADEREDEELKTALLDLFVKNLENVAQEDFSLHIENDWLLVEGMSTNKNGESVQLRGKLCRLEEKNQKTTAHHPAVVTGKDFAYWEIFG